MAKKQVSFDYEAGDITALYRLRSSEADEARLRLLAAELRTMCRLEHSVIIPPTYREITKEVRTPFIRDSWQRITSSMVAKEPLLHVTPKDEQRADYRQSANIAERFDLALLSRMNRELGTDIIYNLMSQVVRDGESVLKVVHKPSAWSNFPLGVGQEDQDNWKKGASLPIAWRDIDRLQVVYEGGEYGDQWFLEYGEYSKPYLKANYGMVDDSSGRGLVDPKHVLTGMPKPENMLTASHGRAVKMEFFTDKEWHVLIDGSEAPGWPKINPYRPYIPYFRATAHEQESLLYSLLFLVPRLDELLTMKLNWGVLGAYPTPVIETVPGTVDLDLPLGEDGDAGPTQPKLTWSPGKVMDLPVGKRLSFLVPPPVGRDLNELITIMKSLIDIAGVPAALRGATNPGDAGYLYSQAHSAAAAAYKIVSMSSQRQLEKAFDFTHWMISNVIRQTVYVLGWSDTKKGKPAKDATQLYLGLSPDKENKFVARIDKLGEIELRFRPQLVTDEQARAMIALQLTNAPKPLSSRRHALEQYMQEDDADSILEEIAVESALESEPLRSIYISEALRDAGLLGALQGSQPGGQGQPGAGMVGGANMPAPNAPQPGMAGIPGLTMPANGTEQGQPVGGGSVPGNTGGRPAGAYPGQPGGPGNG